LTEYREKFARQTCKDSGIDMFCLSPVRAEFLKRRSSPRLHRRTGAAAAVQAARSLFRLVLAVSLICLFLTRTGPAADGEVKNVLVLNSYYPDFSWTISAVEGVEDVFRSYEQWIDFRIQYMDTKRFNDPAHYENLCRLLKNEARGLRYDAILAMDNNALLFLLKYRQELYPSVPIVFCGVDRFHPSMYDVAPSQSSIEAILAGQPNITGVVEEPDYAGTIELAVRLHPLAARIVLVNDRINPSKYWPDVTVDDIPEIVRKYGSRVSFSSFMLKRGNTDRLLSEIVEHPRQTILVLIGDFHDDAADVCFRDSFWEDFWARCDTPIYVTAKALLGFDHVVGGKVNSGYEQGLEAGKMVVRILRGESVQAIPIVYDSPFQYMFDYRWLEHFGVPLSNLPAGTVVLNRPEPFYYRHSKQIVVTLVVLAVTVGILSANILRRRKAERALKESEARYRTLFESSVEGIIIVDAETRRFRYANPAACELLGYTEQQLRLMYLEDIHPDEQLEQVVSDFEAQAEGRKVSAADIPFLKSDGEVIYADVTSASALIDGRKCVIEFLRDITARKLAEQRQRDYLRFLETLIDTIPSPVFYKNTRGVYLGCNRAFAERVLGLPRDRIVGHTLYDFPEIVPRELAEVYQKADDELFANAGVQVYEAQVRCAEGQMRDFIFNKAAFSDGSDKVAGLIAVMVDVTERKRAEQAIRRARDELEERVRQRTAELEKANRDLVNQIRERERAETQLLMYQKKLRSLASELSLAEERMRRRIATDVHDHVGQTLAISKIKAESLVQSVSLPEVASALQEICQLLGQAIENTRMLTFELSPPVLYELGFEAAVEWVVRQVKERYGLSVSFEDDGKSKPLNDDVRVLLFQAVRELLVNVAKHARARSVAVRVQRMNDRIRVVVDDDGVGFDTSQAVTYDYKSGGFGLFSIRERLSHIGGRLEIKSAPGVGTCATVVAPLSNQDTHNQEQAV